MSTKVDTALLGEALKDPHIRMSIDMAILSAMHANQVGVGGVVLALLAQAVKYIQTYSLDPAKSEENVNKAMNYMWAIFDEVPEEATAKLDLN